MPTVFCRRLSNKIISNPSVPRSDKQVQQIKPERRPRPSRHLDKGGNTHDLTSQLWQCFLTYGERHHSALFSSFFCGLYMMYDFSTSKSLVVHVGRWPEGETETSRTSACSQKHNQDERFVAQTDHGCTEQVKLDHPHWLQSMALFLGAWEKLKCLFASFPVRKRQLTFSLGSLFSYNGAKGLIEWRQKGGIKGQLGWTAERQ